MLSVYVLGSTLEVTITRTDPAMGVVTVDWSINAVESIAPQYKFNQYSGTFTFDDVSYHFYSK